MADDTQQCRICGQPAEGKYRMCQSDDCYNRARRICAQVGVPRSRRAFDMIPDEVVAQHVAPTSPPGVVRDGEVAEVTLEPGADLDRAVELLTAAGLNPDEWEPVALTINQWQGMVGHGSTDVVELEQLKVRYRWRRPVEQSTAWRLLERFANPAPLDLPAVEVTRPARDVQRAVLIGDHQAPFTDWHLHQLACAAIADLDPDHLVHMGDLVDLDSVARHPKKTAKLLRSTLNEGLDASVRILHDLAAASPNARRYFITGNHDCRLDKAILARFPDLEDLRPGQVPDDLEADVRSLFSLDRLLRLGELGYELAESELGDYPHGEVRIGNLTMRHGTRARRGAGNSARAAIDASFNGSFAQGHTHRAAVSHVTRWDPDHGLRVYSAIETGTIADPRGLGYTEWPDWQPGFVVVDFYPDGTHSAAPVLYQEGALRFAGDVWSIN